MSNRHYKLGALAGIAFPIMQMTAQGLIQVGGVEPAFTAPAAEILAFFQSRDPALFSVGAYLSSLSLVVFLWFLGALWAALRAVEGGQGGLTAIALGAGLVAAAILSVDGWALAMFRIQDVLDPQTARLLFDMGNLNFANLWVALGGMLLASGLILRKAGGYPRWLGWASLALGAGLLLARAFWISPVAFAPYALFWLWMIVAGVLLYRRAGSTSGTP